MYNKINIFYLLIDCNSVSWYLHRLHSHAQQFHFNNILQLSSYTESTALNKEIILSYLTSYKVHEFLK
jgi:hypothetical protein